MSGLNPDGLGQSERFNNTESESVNADKLGIGAVRTKEHLETVDRTEADGAFNLNVSGYDYDEFVIDGIVQHDTAGTTGYLTLNVNGDTTANYAYGGTELSGTTSGASFWKWAGNGTGFFTNNRQARVMIYVGVDPNTPTGMKTPSFRAELHGQYTGSSYGTLNKDVTGGISSMDFGEEGSRPKHYKFEIYGLSEVGTA